MSHSKVPSSKVSFGNERAILQSHDAVLGLKFFNDRVQAVDVGDDQKIYIFKPDAEIDGEQLVQTIVINIGPLEVKITYDVSTLSVSVQVFLHIPIVGSILIAQASGNLHDGISLTIGYPGILSGSIGIKLSGKDVVLTWNFTAFGKSWKGDRVIFSI